MSKGKIIVQVSNTNGDGVAQAVVTATDTGTGVPRTTETKISGVALFTNVRPGEYIVEVGQPPRQPTKTSCLVGEETVTVNLTVIAV